MIQRWNILVYGDSNAWGWVPVPELHPSSRLTKEDRWPEVMAAALGPGYDVFTDAVPGRTTALDDPNSTLPAISYNGLALLPAAISAHMPLDLVILALGTNDFKTYFDRSPEQIAQDILSLAQETQRNTSEHTGYPPPKALILCPPPLGPLHPLGYIREIFAEGSIARSKALPGVLAPMATDAGHAFFDAGRVIDTGGSDSIHFTAGNHRNLGTTLAEFVRDVL